MRSNNRVLCIIAPSLLCAALLVSARARAQGAAAPTPESDNAHAAQLARDVVARAEALFEAGDYGAALTEFTRAYELLEGDRRQGKVLNNIAVCHERMFRYDLALSYYGRYLREYARTPEDRAEVRAVMRTLEGVLGTVHVTTSVRGEVWIDDRMLGHTPLELRVPAGLHVIEVRARGYQTTRRELRVGARSQQEVVATLQPLPTQRGLDPAFFWTGAGLTAVAVATGSVFGIAALRKDAEGQRKNDEGQLADGRLARELGVKADIAFGVGLAFGIGTSVLYFMTDWGEAHPGEHVDASRVRVFAGPGGGGALVRGRLP